MARAAVEKPINSRRVAPPTEAGAGFPRRVFVGVMLCIAVAGMTAAVFWPVLDAAAVMPDDREYVHTNRLVQNPGWGSARRFLTEVLEPSTVGGYYQPMAMISLMIDVALGAGPDNYRVFHATSLALHVAFTGVTLLFLWAVFGDPWTAAAGALLIGLHPGAIESVAWVSDRKTLLAALFSIASLTTYVRFARADSRHFQLGWYVATCLFFLLALLSKPTATTLPFAMILLDLWPLQRFARRSILEKTPLLLLALVSAGITILSQGRTADVTSATNYPWWTVPLLLCHNVVFYLWKTLWPVQLSAYYPWPRPFNLSQPAVIAGLIGTILLIVALFVSLRRTRAWAVGIGMFFILLLPGMGLLGFTTTITADRFTYLPKIGLALLAVWIIRALWNTGAWPRRAALTAVCLACIGQAVSARAYLARWRDTEGFYRYQAAYAPQSAILQTSLGNVLSGQGRIDEALAAYRRAIALDNEPTAHAALGSLLGQRGDLRGAETHLREAAKLNPNDGVSRANLATILDHTGRGDEAMREIERALSEMPRSASPYFHHAMMLFRRDRLEEARERFQLALTRDPDHAVARYQFGCLLMCEGRFEQGLQQWEAAYGLRPDWPELTRNLGWVWSTFPSPNLRNPKAAIRILNRAGEQTQYSDPDLLDALAAAYAADSNFAEAVAYAKQSIERLQSRGDASAADAVRQRLRLYEQHQPFLEVVQADSFRPR